MTNIPYSKFNLYFWNRIFSTKCHFASVHIDICKNMHIEINSKSYTLRLHTEWVSMFTLCEYVYITASEYFCLFPHAMYVLYELLSFLLWTFHFNVNVFIFCNQIHDFKRVRITTDRRSSHYTLNQVTGMPESECRNQNHFLRVISLLMNEFQWNKKPTTISM